MANFSMFNNLVNDVPQGLPMSPNLMPAPTAPLANMGNMGALPQTPVGAPAVPPSPEEMSFENLFDDNTLLGLGTMAASLLGSEKQFAPPTAYALALGSGSQMAPQSGAAGAVLGNVGFGQFK